MKRMLSRCDARAPEPIATHEVRGGGGLRLHAREWGDPHGPAAAVHPWLVAVPAVLGAADQRRRSPTSSASSPSTSAATACPRSRSDAGPTSTPGCGPTTSPRSSSRPGSTGPCWSPGPTAGSSSPTTCARTATRAIAGINLVGGGGDAAAARLRPHRPGPARERRRRLRARPADEHRRHPRFLRACTAQPLSDDEWSTALCWNMVVPPAGARSADRARDRRRRCPPHLSVPVLVTHGRADAIVLPSMAEHVLDVCATAARVLVRRRRPPAVLEDPDGSTASSPSSRGPPQRSDLKNSRMSPTSSSGASCGEKWLPRS